jgi:hypothetical protein
MAKKKSQIVGALEEFLADLKTQKSIKVETVRCFPADRCIIRDGFVYVFEPRRMSMKELLRGQVKRKRV